MELIKASKVTESIEFAQRHLSSQCFHTEDSVLKQRFQDEVDRTMTLLMYEDPTKSPHADLADLTARQKLASQVNKAILEASNQSSDLKLEFFWKLMQYSEGQLQGLEFPRLSADIDFE